MSWAEEAASDVVEVLRHDVAADPPPPGGFDLVHARLVLVHVVDRAEALRRMVQALRPGGVLLLEDADPGLQPLLCPDESGPEQRLANRLRSGFRELMAARGADLSYGRTLPRLLREAGLLDVQADAYFPITSPACTVLEAATVRQIRGRLRGGGHRDRRGHRPPSGPRGHRTAGPRHGPDGLRLGTPPLAAPVDTVTLLTGEVVGRRGRGRRTPTMCSGRAAVHGLRRPAAEDGRSSLSPVAPAPESPAHSASPRGVRRACQRPPPGTTVTTPW